MYNFYTILLKYSTLNYALCPELVPAENVKEYQCGKNACKMICEPGARPIGKRRIKCEKNEDGDPEWSDDFGECVRCDEPTNFHSRDVCKI